VNGNTRRSQAIERWAWVGFAWLLTIPLTACRSPLTGQAPPGLEQERRDFARWLESAPLSPYGLLALQPVGLGISIGYEPSDIPLPITTRGIAGEANGVVTLDLGASRLVLPRGQAVPLERFQLVASGAPGRTVIAAYGAARRHQPPTYFPYAASLSVGVTLEPPERRGWFRILGLDGVETEATEAGFVRVVLSGKTTRLRVYRIGAPEDEDAGLLIFARDGTSGHGSYPAGRFVELVPEGGQRFRLDFNRARNPFCAYSSAYPCPAPWPGNVLPARVEAGEQYPEAPGATGQ
jgi:hypothetical protein